jgi:uncharacterized protein (DUF697 family)
MQGYESELDALEVDGGEMAWEPSGEDSFAGEDALEGEAYDADETQLPFDEVMEMELAGTLLDVASEGELDQFLGNLIQRAGRAVGAVVRSPVGRALGGILKSAARKALPIVGGAVGSAIAGPAGGRMGGRIASTAGRLFGLELEGMSPEDQEYEVARRFVRFAGTAAGNAADAPPTMAPERAARSAAIAAARRHAPGLLRAVASGAGHPGTPGGGGRWLRRGRHLVVLNVYRTE